MEEKKVAPPTYDESCASATPSAPSINEGFEPEEGILKPPTAPPYVCPTAPPRPSIPNLPRLTDPEIREACVEYIADHCCYGSRFIRDMILTDIQNSCAFHYKLESYGEMRESKWTYEGYYGQNIDGPENGPVPQPWDIRVRTPTNFVDDWTTKEIPHTAYVKQCDSCVGNGKVRCDSCYGRGSETCSSCNGRGKNSDDERCTWCSGSGNRTCYRCDGRGMITCSKCDGHGRLKHCKQLIVTWKNHVDNFVSDTWNLPRDLIQEVAGREIFKEQNEQISPLNHSPDGSVNQASARLVQTHSTSFVNEQILQQRHNLRAVPLTKVCWIWRRKHGEFYVYGFQKKVYFEEYPQPCCCCTCC